MRNMIRLQMVCIFALFAELAFGYDVGDYSYSYNLSTKEGTITDYRGTASNISIPSSFTVAETYRDPDDGETHTRHHTITVAGIGNSVFANKTFIKSISFHDKIKTIGGEAFRGCTGIESVSTSESLTYLGPVAFSGCTGLVEAVINGTGLDLSGSRGLFEGCASLRRVAFGDGVTKFFSGSGSGWSTCSGMFANCANLRQVSVGSGVSEVPMYFLIGCGSLEEGLSVSFGGLISRIGDDAFRSDSITGLEMRLAQGCTVGGSAFLGSPGVNERNIDFSKIAQVGNSAFYRCVNIAGAIDLSNAESIGGEAFWGCTGIVEVKLGSVLKAIGSSAFLGCAMAASFAFRSAPPSVGSFAFKNVKSGAVGTYTAEHATEWEAVIDSKGYWNGLKMKPAYYTVIYDANNGSGARSTTTVEWGVPTAAGVGTFTWEAHYFMGWAFEVSGGDILDANDILPEPQEGNVTTLYGQWATFEPVSADWQAGSITLKATGVAAREDEDFFLSCCDAASADSEGAHWEYVEDAVKVLEGNAIRLTDTEFSERLGGIPAVKYRLQIGKSVDDIRATLYCTTRTRHAIAIGLSEWDESVWNNRDTGGAKNASLFAELAASSGGFTDVLKCMNSEAKTNDVAKAFAEVADATRPGDVCVFFINTHGNNVNGVASLALYDASYTDQQLSSDIAKLQAENKGVAVVGIVSACHSGALFNNPEMSDSNAAWYLAKNLAQCSPNVAWITSSDAGHNGYGIFSKFLLHYGWNGQWAANDERMTFLGLGRYAKRQYDAIFNGVKFSNRDGNEAESKTAQVFNDPLLSHVFVRFVSDSHKERIIPDTPDMVEVSKAAYRDKITASWNAVPGADDYVVFVKFGTEEWWYAAWYDVPTTQVEFSIGKDDRDYDAFAQFEQTGESYPAYFAVRSYNGAGVSELSSLMGGWVDSSWTIVFDAGEGRVVGSWQGLVAGPLDTRFVKTMARGDRFALEVLPEAVRDGYVLESWTTSQGTVATSNTIAVESVIYRAKWTAMTKAWLDRYMNIAQASKGDIAAAARMTAANGCRTVGECYALGIDPEDPKDDLKITDFKIENGKPVIQLNHTKDGSGNSFETRIKTLGKKSLSDVDWVEITDIDQSAFRFFKATVDLP